MTSPFRDAPISPSEVRRILRRAAEIAERDPETASAERAMTREELERAAAELGLPASAIARAIDHEEPEAGEVEGHWFLGGKTRIVLERDRIGPTPLNHSPPHLASPAYPVLVHTTVATHSKTQHTHSVVHEGKGLK